MNQTTEPIAIREGRKIVGYSYREVNIKRIEGGFEFIFDRYDREVVERFARTRSEIIALVDKTLDQQGRTYNARPIVAMAINGMVVSALGHPDWMFPNARCLSINGTLA